MSIYYTIIIIQERKYLLQTNNGQYESTMYNGILIAMEI